MQQLESIFRSGAVGIYQPVSDIQQLICHAELSRSSVLKLARALAIELKLDPELSVEMGPIKTLQRIWDKALGSKDGHVERVTDICRQRLKVESYKDIQQLRKLFRNPAFHEEWERKGVEIEEFEDYFAQPNKRGFRAINILMRVDLGKGRSHVCELQVIHKDMEQALETSRQHYLKIRETEEKAASQGRELDRDEISEVNRLIKETIRLHDEAAERLNLRYLETPRVIYSAAPLPLRAAA